MKKTLILTLVALFPLLGLAQGAHAVNGGVSISTDRPEVPLPTFFSTTAITVTITDPSKNLNPGASDTIVFLSTGGGITVTDSTGTIRPTSSIGGLVNKTFSETGPSTGVFNSNYTISTGTLSTALMNGAKIKFSYGTSSTSITLKAYDGKITSDKLTVIEGSVLTVKVLDQDGNRDPNVRDFLTISANTRNDMVGPTLSFTLEETDLNSGEFAKELVIGTDIQVENPLFNLSATRLVFQYPDQVASDGSLVYRELLVKVGPPQEPALACIEFTTNSTLNGFHECRTDARNLELLWLDYNSPITTVDGGIVDVSFTHNGNVISSIENPPNTRGLFIEWDPFSGNIDSFVWIGTLPYEVTPPPEANDFEFKISKAFDTNVLPYSSWGTGSEAFGIGHSPDTNDAHLTLNLVHPTSVVGGEILSVDSTNLFVAGAFANAGLIIPIVGATAGGILGFVLRKRIR